MKAIFMNSEKKVKHLILADYYTISPGKYIVSFD